MNSDTQITALAPSGAPGVDNVRVTTYSGQSTTGGGNAFEYLGGPTVSTMTAATGSTAGGTTFTLTGADFSQATGVFFGDTPATSYTVNSRTSITVTSPPRPAGIADVTVTTYSGTSPVVAATKFTYTLGSPPTVTGIGPNTGTTLGGTSVVITGTNFSGTTAVLFGTVPATSFTVDSPTQITAVSPPQAVGQPHITVTTYSGTSLPVTADKFTYTLGALPTVSALSPANGSSGGGTEVTITGTNFSGVTKVFFGTVEAAFFVNSATSITAYAPPQMPDPANVRVIVRTYSGDSSASGTDVFSYQAAPPPTVTGLSPSNGTQAGGTSVTITGTNLRGASAVLFGTVPAVWFSVDSDTQITAIAPAQATGTVNVRVTTPTGQSPAGGGNQFTYLAVAAPTVTSLSATSGSKLGGRTITITGTNFIGVTDVSFGYVRATSFTVDSATQITAVTPAHYEGRAHVTVTTAYGSSATSASDLFQFLTVAPPTVTGLSPPNGTTGGGTSVIITGTNFTYASTVLFGSVPAVSFTVNSATQITAVAPPQAAGNVYVTVTSDGGTSVNSVQFLYEAAPLPAVSGLSVASGTTLGGTWITITGTNFLGAYEVKFGTTLATTFVVDSATQISVLVPPRLTGAADVQVRTYSGWSPTNPNDLFTYVQGAVPIVSSVSPTSGSTAGNVIIVISGVYFTGVTAVRFGTVDATSFTLNSDGQITVVAPAQGAGIVDVIIVTTGGTSEITTADQYTLVAATTPTVTALDPLQGTNQGGTFVKISGVYFTGATSVLFGMNPATWFLVESDASIVALSPGGLPGTAMITVTTPLGTSAPVPFMYIAPAVVQELRSSFRPTTGGGAVTILGTGFVGVTAVYFDGVSVGFTVDSPTQITITAAPAHAPGVAYVTVETTPGIFSALTGQAEFTYVLAPLRWHADYTANTLPANDDSSGEIALGFTIDFFGRQFSTVWVNNNGNVSFDGPLSDFTPFSMASSTVAIIAPFFADVDTRQGAIVSYGTGTVNGNLAFVVNWVNVGYYDQHVDKTNVFQLVLINLGAGAFQIEFNYAWITWETGDGSGGSEGLGGESARAGYANGTLNAGTWYELGGSGVNSALLDTHPSTGLVNGQNSSSEYGRYVYTIGGSGPGGGGGGQDDPGQSSVPVIRGMKPRRGSVAGGTLVTLVGAQFQNVTEILFGTTSVRTFQVYGGRRIVVTAPPHAPQLVFLRVRTSSGVSDLTPVGRFLYEGHSAPSGGGGEDGGQEPADFVQAIAGLEQVLALRPGQGPCIPLFRPGQADVVSSLRPARSRYLDPVPPAEETAGGLSLRKLAFRSAVVPVLDGYFADLLKEEVARQSGHPPWENC